MTRSVRLAVEVVNDLIHIESADRRLLQDIDAALAEAARRSGAWLVCRPGCTPCCMGPFSITALDALRLDRGMRQLERSDPNRARAVRQRAAEYIAQIAEQFAGDLGTGKLEDEDTLPEAMDEAPCPALDPESGCCDLYQHRPITCRTFGPPVEVAGGLLGACELCYEGATGAEISACAVAPDPGNREAALLEDLNRAGMGGATIVAFPLAKPWQHAG